MPVQWSPVEKSVVLKWGRCASTDLQHSCRGQSLLCLHVCGQVCWHCPWQQTWLDPTSQSEDWVRALGQGSYAGFRHRPAALRLGSARRTVVQQISPAEALHSDEAEQAFGQNNDGTHRACL